MENLRKPHEHTCGHCGCTLIIRYIKCDNVKWQSGQAQIQDVLSYLDPGDRELIISGRCDSCWQEMCGDEDEDAEDWDDEDDD